MWMLSPYTKATNLVLGEYKSLVPAGPGVMSTSNGGRHSECAEANGKLEAECEYLKQCSDRCGGDTGNKSAWLFLN